jgi:hypothetical protein
MQIFEGLKLHLTTSWNFSQGQISPSTEVGRWISALASLSEVKSIVEIGTWSGLGSTKCIQSGLKSRSSHDTDSLLVISLEVDSKMFKVAKRNLRANPKIKLLWGSLVSERQLDMEDLTNDERTWLEADKLKIRQAPNVLDQIPANIDLLVLDGGEFSTGAEFQALKSRLTKLVVLDDTRTRKNRRVFEELKGDRAWFLVHESEERNGTAVFRRRDDD